MVTLQSIQHRSVRRRLAADRTASRIAKRGAACGFAVMAGVVLGVCVANQGAAILRTALVVVIVIALFRRVRAR